MSVIRWVHISDLHFGYDPYIVEEMRNKLLFLTKEIVPIDYLFITGDLRYGKTEHIRYPKDTIEFINRLQCLLKIDKQSTFMVAGNHDINRSKELETLVDSIKSEYRTSNGIISAETLDYIKKQRKPFLKLYKELCNRDEVSIHYSVETECFNIININTALMSCKDGEDGDLIIGTQLLRSMTKSVNLSKPSIVLAHHPFDSLRLEEQRELEIILKDCNAILYLCGHKHVALSDNIKKYRQEKDLWLYSCGTNMDMDPQLDATDMDIFVGEIDTNNLCGYIQAYKWSKKNSAWIPDSDFSFPQNGALDGKQYFPPNIRPIFSKIDKKNLLESYYKYIQFECGEIQLNGLPVDAEVGQRKFELEKIFVPLSFKEIKFDIDNTFIVDNIPLGRMDIDIHNFQTNMRLSLDKIIPANGSFHNFILSSPGGGKTTLLKWIASVYCFPDKYKEKNTYLPLRDLFPIWIKCRDINIASHPTILDIIFDIARQAELIADSNSLDNFVSLLHYYIENGTALLLIDGLDEINNESERANFINQLGRFINANPLVNVIVTSRIAGFSDVTQNKFDEFKCYEILNFIDSDIQKLCTDWYKIVVGTQESTLTKAQSLADVIIKHKHIKSLASNPLMLTTLLLVERRVGRLPTKRVALYSEAIQVLLETWNLEGYLPIDLDEARYQLAYVAYQMMIEHKQAISESKLIQILKNARKELTGLVFDKDSYTSFIRKIERRSALLIQKGYAIDSESEKLEKVYEFQHLTFQEYLAAYAIAQKCYPGAKKDDILSNVLEQYLKKEYMKEVILLSVVLLDRWSVDELVESIISTLKSKDLSFKERSYLRLLLLQFVADEAPMQNRNSVYECCFDSYMLKEDIDAMRSVLCSKYASEFARFIKQMDNKRNDLAYTSVIMLLENECLNAYQYYINNRNSTDSEQVLKAIAVLDSALWINRKNIIDLLDEIQKVKLKDELFDFAKCDNIKIQKQALSALRMSSILDKAEDYNKYFDLYVLYINKTNTVPVIMDCITKKIFIENCKSISLTRSAVDAIRTSIANNVLYSSFAYKEWITLFLILLVYSDDEMLSSDFDDLMYKREKMVLLNDCEWRSFEKTDKAFIKILEALVLNNISIDTRKKQVIQSYISVLNEAWDSYKKEIREKMLAQFINEDEMSSGLLNNTQRLSNADIDIMIAEIDEKLAELERLESVTKGQDKDGE